MKDMVSKNRSMFGERQHLHKLTEDQVVTIRALYAGGNMTQQDLADQFGVQRTTIGRVVRRKTWLRAA
ncbi:helix-turn-helix domain-containing protein [Cryobacterium sp. PH31-O1]|uniref:MarR family transcriptional regulator n=1 Tax=Cryobacterium sp. PH31-O1 TaxID=3046306 RepID=UPI0024BAFC0A|nr:helix-turn-helix domain-containing protein [Cryobacterium sp. PH31-O1]MDJ0337467.1 helix-turn-helix domain-containing protein [Cryobacterium sp. PH31-O1]